MNNNHRDNKPKIKDTKMRDLTKDEEEACNNALYNISESTGINLFNIKKGDKI